jgi:hypothetical protein
MAEPEPAPQDVQEIAEARANLAFACLDPSDGLEHHNFNRHPSSSITTARINVSA